MKRTRILSSIILLAAIVPSLFATVYAHPGGTDANGGHTDRSTGEYHFHHGQSAHAHYDMDGDGDLDCPYNFVDTTGAISKKSSSSSGSSTVLRSGEGYNDGYSDGYEKGKSTGYDTGFSKGYDEGYYEGNQIGIDVTTQNLVQKYESALSTAKYESVLYTIIFTTLFYGSILLLRRNKSKKQIEDIQDTYERKIKHIAAEHSATVAQLKQSHENDISTWKERYLKEKHNVTILTIAAGKDPTVKLPPDIRLRKSFTVIKGKRREFYPYGDYTVFMSRTSRKYHCSHKCSATAKPLHFFDLPREAEPCFNCVRKDMYPQALPDWYVQLKNNIE